MKTIQEKRKDALNRMIRAQERASEKLHDLELSRKSMAGRTGVPVWEKESLDRHIEMYKRDTARRAAEMQNLRLLIR